MEVLRSIKNFRGHGRTLAVIFTCNRCGCEIVRALEDCLPKDGPPTGLHDLKPPSRWRNGGFYYPTFCPDCAEKYDRFMKGDPL